MLIRLDPSSATPVYEQIVDAVTGGIRDGDLPTDTRLPTVRQLAADLGVRTAVADFEDHASLDAAFSGAEAVLLVSGSEVGKRVAQHTAAIDAEIARLSALRSEMATMRDALPAAVCPPPVPGTWCPPDEGR